MLDEITGKMLKLNMTCPLIRLLSRILNLAITTYFTISECFKISVVTQILKTCDKSNLTLKIITQPHKVINIKYLLLILFKMISIFTAYIGKWIYLLATEFS